MHALRSLFLLTKGKYRAPRVLSRSIAAASLSTQSDKKSEEREEATPDETTDFLTKHGGKIGLAVFSGVVWLIYRWFEGGKNKRLVEEALSHESPLHPYESNDLRLKNSMSVDQFKRFSSACISHFSSGLASYKDFLIYLHESSDYKIIDAYVLDRLVLYYIQKHMQLVDACIEDDIKLPVGFLLVVLSNVVAGTPGDRAELLFDVCMNLPTVAESSSICDMNGDIYCSKGQAELLVTHLDLAWQIPYEKHIQETGVDWPYKTYRRKTAAEMVEQGEARMKPPPHKTGFLSQAEFEGLIQGSAVCAWGECYRGK